MPIGPCGMGPITFDGFSFFPLYITFCQITCTSTWVMNVNTFDASAPDLASYSWSFLPPQKEDHRMALLSAAGPSWDEWLPGGRTTRIPE